MKRNDGHFDAGASDEDAPPAPLGPFSARSEAAQRQARAAHSATGATVTQSRRSGGGVLLGIAAALALGIGGVAAYATFFAGPSTETASGAMSTSLPVESMAARDRLYGGEPRDTQVIAIAPPEIIAYDVSGDANAADIARMTTVAAIAPETGPDSGNDGSGEPAVTAPAAQPSELAMSRSGLLAGLPPWRRYAVAPPAMQGKALVAIIIDDMGLDSNASARAMAIDAPLTLSFLPYAPGVAAQAERASTLGHEIMVHLPMEPESSEDPGPNALLVELSREEMLRRLSWNLAQFDGFVGVNNHMGSLLTRNAGIMEFVLADLRDRGLLFVDSRTTARSVAGPIARRLGMPAGDRDVFLDDLTEPADIAASFDALEQKAERWGAAIGIIHPRPESLDALEAWIAGLPRKRVTLAPITTIIKRLRTASPS